MPYLSIIIPTLNSEKVIGTCLESVKKNDYTDYEIIVVDGGSVDGTIPIVRRYTDKVVVLQEDAGRANARDVGMSRAAGGIFVFTDSDNVLRPDTLSKIASFLSANPETDAVVGLISKEHPNRDFFSQYKNLYMNYIFNRLPERITFLHGSIYAVRRHVMPMAQDLKIKTDDTERGQSLFSRGGVIIFLKDLEVVHLKRYSFASFIKNDFLVPFDWAKILLRYGGLKQIGRHKTGYAHSPKEQLASVVIAPAIVLLLLLRLAGYGSTFLIAALTAVWVVLNIGFFRFLAAERGPAFLLGSVLVTFLDNIVMAAGITCGLLTALTSGKPDVASADAPKHISARK